MKLRILQVLVLSLALAPAVSAQSKSKKQIRQERKAARQMEKYLAEKQALRDTSYIFITKKILFPHTSNSMTGGYLDVGGNSVRVQELDWVETTDIKTRIVGQAPIEGYSVSSNEATGQTVVNFRCQLKAKLYAFTIVYNRFSESELTVQATGRKTMRYSGVVKAK